MINKKECERFRRLANEAVDGFISESDRLSLNSHIEQCQECREYMEQIEKISSAASLIQFDEPAYLESKIMMSIEAAVEAAEKVKKPLFTPALSYGISFAIVFFMSTFLIYNNVSEKADIKEFASVPVAEKEVVSDVASAKSDDSVTNSEQRIANSEQPIANDEQRIANDEQRTANSEFVKDVPVFKYSPKKQVADSAVVESKETLVKQSENTGYRIAASEESTPTPVNDLLERDKAIVANNMINPYVGQGATIKIKVEEDSKVRVIIYDKRVRVVSNLIDEDKTPGLYEVSWYGKNENNEVVRDGVYFVYIQIGKRVIKKKIIVVK